MNLQQNSEGTITFKLVPSDGKGGQRESKVRVRAHFDYNPDNDPYIPCKEAGLAFERGEILHIVSQVNRYISMDANQLIEKCFFLYERMTLIGGKQEKKLIEAHELVSYQAELCKSEELFMSERLRSRMVNQKVSRSFCHLKLS